MKARIVRGVILPEKDLTPHNGKQIDITINGDLKEPTRSLKQNSYYFGVLIPIIIDFHLNNTGEILRKEDVHAFNQVTIWNAQPKIISIGDKKAIYYDIESTSTMSTKRFNEFVNKIILWYQENMELHIPGPDEL